MSASRITLTLSAVAGLLCVSSAEAQVNSAIGATEQQRQQRELEDTLNRSKRNAQGTGSALEVAPELFAGELDDVGPQEILTARRRVNWFNVDTDTQFFYTSNSGLAENEDDTTMLVNTVSLSAGPEVIDTKWGELRPRFGYRHQFFNYALAGSQAAPGVGDFDSQALFGYVGLTTANQWQYLLSLEYQRLLDHAPTFSSYKEFYRDWVPRFSVSKTIARSETRYFTLNYQAAYHFSESPRDFTDIDIQDRMEQVFTASYTHGFNPRLVGQPFYRLIHNHYGNQSGRDDLTHSFGALLLYSINDMFSLRTFCAWDARESDLPIIADYRKFDIGGALHFAYKF